LDGSVGAEEIKEESWKEPINGGCFLRRTIEVLNWNQSG